MNEIMEGVYRNKSSANPSPAVTPTSPITKRDKVTEKGKREELDEESDGNGNSHVLVVGHVNSRETGLEGVQVAVLPNSVDDTAEQAEKERKEKEAAETAKKAGAHGGNSTPSSSVLPKQSVIENGETEAAAATDHNDDVVVNAGCCGGRKWRWFGRR